MRTARKTELACPHCGGIVELGFAVVRQLWKAVSSRSTPQHRRYMALIKAAYHHWPESHEFQPESETHLRKWLQVSAGYREHTDIPVVFAEDEPAVTRLAALAIEAAIMAAEGYAFVRPHPDGGIVRVYRSRSISYDTLGHLEACALFDAVAEIIESVIGRSADEILKQTEQAA